MVVDESSLFVHDETAADVSAYNVIEENEDNMKYTTSASFKPRAKAERWSKDETVKFYQVRGFTRRMVGRHSQALNCGAAHFLLRGDAENYIRALFDVVFVAWCTQALRDFGTDFGLIQQLFPHKTRKQIRMKFKREERAHRSIVEAALTTSSQIGM